MLRLSEKMPCLLSLELELLKNTEEILKSLGNQTDLSYFITTDLASIQAPVSEVVRPSHSEKAWYPVPALLHVVMTQEQCQCVFDHGCHSRPYMGSQCQVQHVYTFFLKPTTWGNWKSM